MNVVCDSVTRRRMQLIVDVGFHVPACAGARVLADVDPYLDGLRDLRGLLERLFATGNVCLNCQTAYRFIAKVEDTHGAPEFQVQQRAFSDVFEHLWLNAAHCRQLREDLDAGIFVDRSGDLVQFQEEARGLWRDAEKHLAKAASEG